MTLPANNLSPMDPKQPVARSEAWPSTAWPNGAEDFDRDEVDYSAGEAP